MPLFTAYTRLRAARKSFARAVRRIELGQTGGMEPAALEIALLAGEREPVAPLAVKERVMERVRAAVPTFRRRTWPRPPPRRDGS